MDHIHKIQEEIFPKENKGDDEDSFRIKKETDSHWTSFQSAKGSQLGSLCLSYFSA